MVEKPKICLIDDDPRVHVGWQQCLSPHAELHSFRDPVEFLKAMDKTQLSGASYECIVVGRLFPHLGMDLLHSDLIGAMRSKIQSPLFLNWQGYIGTKELEKRFDGKVFHRFGIKWHTLKIRLQRLEKSKRCVVSRPVESKEVPVSHAPAAVGQVASALRRDQTLKSFSIKGKNKAQRCKDILQLMAAKADVTSREKLLRFVTSDPQKGVQLLEALYNRLITYREPPANCPSRFINSSPLIAAKLLREALHP